MTDDLKTRVAQRAEQNGNGEGGDQPVHPLLVVHQNLTRMQPEIEKALPSVGMSAERFTRIVYTQVRHNPKLAECTPESLAGAILTCAQLGLEPGGPTGEAWILPYWNNADGAKRYEASFQLGYKGMASLFWRHPLAMYLDAQTVYENDEFDYDYGLEPYLKHKPARSERGKETGLWYAVARLTNGGYRFIVLNQLDVERHRQKSKSPNSPAWRNDYNAMAKKCCVKEMFALLPKSAEAGRALAQDEQVRTSLDPETIDAEPDDVIPGRVLEEPDAAPASAPEPRPADPLHYDESDGA